MSKRVGFAVEGETDLIVLQAVLAKMIPDDFSPRYLQPAGYGCDRDPSKGAGWPGVMRWCIEISKNHNSLRDLDLVIVQIDADVAEMKYSDASIRWQANDLPCVKPCPPAQDTVTALEQVVSGWLGGVLPPKLILCIPSRQIDSWLVPLLYSDKSTNLECSKEVFSWLSAHKKKLCRQNGKKITESYRKIASELGEKWDTVKAACSQAAIFEQRVRQII